MFPITNQTLIGAIRSGMLVGWVAVFRWLSENDWLNSYVGFQEFLEGLNTWVEGGVILFVSGLVAGAAWALVTKVAEWRGRGGFLGLLGTAAAFVFVIPTAPTYDVPPSG